MSKSWPFVKTDKIHKTLARLNETKKKKKTKDKIANIRNEMITT